MRIHIRPASAQAPRATWRGGWLPRLALAALYIAGWSALSLIHPHASDLDTFFLPAALVALHGRPLFIYSVSHQQGYPLANGPLSVAPLVAALALASSLGWLRSVALTRWLVIAVASVFSLLMAREAVHVVDRLTPQPPRGARRLLVYEVVLISLQLWQSMLYYGHVEQPLMLWLALLGVRLLGERKPGRAGVALGLALLTRTTALTVILPLALLLVSQRQWRELWRYGVAVVGVVTAGLLPFALADGPDLLYSLVTFHNSRGVYGGNLWTLLGGPIFTAIAQRADGAVVVVATLLVAALALRARPALSLQSRDLYALLALCSLCHPAFINILWPYYFLEAFIFLVVWWLAGIGALAERGETRLRWWLAGLLPLGVTLLSQARQFALAQQFAMASDQTPEAIAWNLLTCCALVAVMAALALRLWRRPAQALGQ